MKDTLTLNESTISLYLLYVYNALFKHVMIQLFVHQDNLLHSYVCMEINPCYKRQKNKKKKQCKTTCACIVFDVKKKERKEKKPK